MGGVQGRHAAAVQGQLGVRLRADLLARQQVPADGRRQGRRAVPDVHGRRIQARYGPHKTNVTSIDFSPDAKLVVSTSGSYLYDDKGRIVVKDGKYVYTDCVMRLWDRETAEETAAVKDVPTPSTRRRSRPTARRCTRATTRRRCGGSASRRTS